MSEYPEPDHPIHRAAWKHKLTLRALFSEIGANAGVKHPAAFGDTIGMLVDGAIVPRTPPARPIPPIPRGLPPSA